MSVVYGGNKGHGGYVCTALPSNAGAQSCLYAPRLNTDEAVVEAFFEAIRPAELDLLEEALEVQSKDRERLLQPPRQHKGGPLRGTTGREALPQRGSGEQAGSG